jgi:hypothetical protein
MDVQRTSEPNRIEQWAPALALGLGGFSIALGLMELIAPRTLARTLGMEGSEKLLAGYGVREIGAGIGILAAQNPGPWVWARVAGDVLDIGTLASGLGPRHRQRANVLAALGAVLGVSVLDVLGAVALSSKTRRPRMVRDYGDRRGMPRPAAEMRGLARDFQAPRDMRIPEALRPYSAR